MQEATARMQTAIETVLYKLGVVGSLCVFGSCLNGFQTGTSDLDIVFFGKPSVDNAVSLLAGMCAHLPEAGFTDVIKIFQAKMPLLKFTDVATGVDVDFVIGNYLGVRNTMLLNAYCRCDTRVPSLGKLVKHWAKRFELVGVPDGYLNSYAYMLLLIYFLQSRSPPVLPNLQQCSNESYPVPDTKWGRNDVWETKFEDDVDVLPVSENQQTAEDLFAEFFRYYSTVFDWQHHAVCIRLAQPGKAIDKYSLLNPTDADQWYIEDPFDLRHNLASKCSFMAKKRILKHMHRAWLILSVPGHFRWSEVCPPGTVDKYYLKTRVSPKLTAAQLLERFQGMGVTTLYFPEVDPNNRQGRVAFLEFLSNATRRRAHTLNDTYVLDCQLQLLLSSQHAVQEALEQGRYAVHDVAQQTVTESL